MSKDTLNEPVDTIEDLISSAIDEAEGIKDEATEESEVSEPEATEAKPAEDGGDPGDEGIAASADEDEPGESVDADEPAEEPLEAPQHWSQQDKELFVSQPREAQEWLLSRHKAMEGDYTRKQQEFAPEKRQWESVKDALEPHRAQFERAGLDYAGAVRQLASWDNALKTSGKTALLELAQTYGIDLNEPESDEYIDPQVKQLQSELQQVKQFTTQQMQAAQQQRQAEIATTIHAFRDETDGSGNKLHPHFEELQGDITALFNAGLCNDLESGYNKALAMRPDLQASQTPSATQTDEADRSATVRKAKRAATGVKSSGAVAKKNREEMSLEEEIASHFN